MFRKRKDDAVTRFAAALAPLSNARDELGTDPKQKASPGSVPDWLYPRYNVADLEDLLSMLRQKQLDGSYNFVDGWRAHSFARRAKVLLPVYQNTAAQMKVHWPQEEERN